MGSFWNNCDVSQPEHVSLVFLWLICFYLNFWSCDWFTSRQHKLNETNKTEQVQDRGVIPGVMKMEDIFNVAVRLTPLWDWLLNFKLLHENKYSVTYFYGNVWTDKTCNDWGVSKRKKVHKKVHDLNCHQSWAWHVLDAQMHEGDLTFKCN